MKLVIVSLVAAAALSGPAVADTYTGTITDSMCATADHSGMRMGPTDAECTLACVEGHGATFVLSDGTNTYALSDQKAPEKLAGKRVTVTGRLDTKTKTIAVDSIALAR